MSSVQTHCGGCGTPYARGQQYCLTCGSRVGPRRPEVEALRANAGRRSAAPPAGAADPAAADLPSWFPRLRLPPIGVCGVLIVAFFASGIAVGAFERHAVDSQLAAAAGRQIRILAAGSPGGQETSPEPVEPFESGSGETGPGGGEGPATQTGGGGEESEPEHEKAEHHEGGPGREPLSALPPVHHVFLITLSNEPYAKVFGPSSPSPYLSHTLLEQGELLPGYYAVAHNELANLIAMVSGQGPTLQTAENCPRYQAVSVTRQAAYEQLIGNGCVYPTSLRSLPAELETHRLKWRAYVQGIDEGPGTPPACAHPPLGELDPTSGPSPASGTYATFRNPFMYLASVTGSSSCASDVVGLGALGGDLASAARTPNFVDIIPGRCNDGSPTPCRSGASAGVKDSESLLRRIVPQITGSAAFKKDGLLIITVDQAPSSGVYEDSSSCCGQPNFPNLPPTEEGLPSGGGSVGALLISPWNQGGTTNPESLNHFSLLKTVDRFFALRDRGFAASREVPAFPPSLFVARG